MNIPDKLDTGDTPLTEGGGKGGLAYFPQDVVMYDGPYGPYSGLYDLGTAVSGSGWSRTCPVKSLRPQKRHPVQVCSQGTKRIGPGRMQKPSQSAVCRRRGRGCRGMPIRI